MIKSLAVAFSISLIMPGLAAANTFTVPHSQGETVIEGTPQTVMVTDWAAFDNLTALGVQVAGIPGGNVPDHLADKVTDHMVRLGALKEPDIEGIAAAKPDLVIVAGRSRTSYPTLSKISPTLDMSVDNGALLDGVKASLVTLGRIFDREARAAELIADLDAKVEEARVAAAGKGTGLVIVTNAGKIGVYGPQSRVSWIYNTLDIPSVFDTVDDRDHGGNAINFEYLLKTNPDWLFVVDRDAGVGNKGAAHQLLDNELVHRTSFWKNNRIVYLDPAASYVTMHGYDALMLLLDQVIAGYKAQ